MSSAKLAVLTVKVLTAESPKGADPGPEGVIAGSGGRAVVGGRGRLSPTVQIKGESSERAEITLVYFQ